MSTDELIKLQREVARLRDQNSSLRRSVKRLATHGAVYDAFVEQLNQFELDTGYKAQAVRLGKPANKTHDEIACVAVSDLHLSERVYPGDVYGLNVFNSIVAANRLWDYAQTAKSIIKMHTAMYRVRSIWSPLLGDVISGSIHDELRLTNDLTDIAATVLGARLLSMFYRELASLRVPVEIDAIHGNHPRTTPTMPTKRQAHTNLDWAVYEMLTDILAKDQSIKVNVHTSAIATMKLYGWNYVFEHGVGVRHGKEEAFEERIRALFDDPKVRRANNITGTTFDQIVIGNLHKAKFLERTIVNGCFSGMTELTVAWKLQPITAIQMMWGIAEKHARTWQYQIELSDVMSTKATNPFSDYTAWFLKKHGSNI